MKNSNFPQINTFGSMMRYAITLEEFMIESYSKATLHPEFRDKKDIFQNLHKKHQKNKKRLENALRLKLNEITIEPVTSLKGDDYLLEIGDITAEELIDTIDTFKKLEETCSGFYKDSADYSLVIAREISRLFSRFAKDNSKNIGLL